MRRDGGVMASGTLSGKEDNLHFLLKVKQKYIERFGFDNLTVPFKLNQMPLMDFLISSCLIRLTQ